MSQKGNDEVKVSTSDETIDKWITQSFIPIELRPALKEADVLILPELRDGKPIFTEHTYDLYQFLDKESELSTEICITDKDFQFSRLEAALDIINIGVFLIKGLSYLKKFIEKVKEFLRHKVKKDGGVELKIIVQKTTQRATTSKEAYYKGSLEGLDKILEYAEKWK